METIRSISCSIPVNQGVTHLINKPADVPCTSTQNVQNTNIARSLSDMCAEKPQDEVITKLDAPLRFKKITRRNNVPSRTDILRKKRRTGIVRSDICLRAYFCRIKYTLVRPMFPWELK